MPKSFNVDDITLEVVQNLLTAAEIVGDSLTASFCDDTITWLKLKEQGVDSANGSLPRCVKGVLDALNMGLKSESHGE